MKYSTLEMLHYFLEFQLKMQLLFSFLFMIFMINSQVYNSNAPLFLGIDLRNDKMIYNDFNSMALNCPFDTDNLIR